jgi:peptide/nickel transport system substrate-binding protein
VDSFTVTRIASSEEVLEGAMTLLPATLDPAISYDSAGWSIIENVYETLVWYNGTDLSSLKPILATTVPTVGNGGVTDGGKTYTFHLREDVTFHDGTVMDAYDVKYSLARVLMINDQTGPAWMLGRYTISGYGSGVLDEGLIDAAFEVLDAHTIAIHLVQPYDPFLQILATPVASIVSMEYVLANHPDVAGQSNTWMAGHACGSGPFRLGELVAGSTLMLERFDSYRLAPAALPGVLVHQMSQIEAKSQMEAGTIDVLLETPPTNSRAQFEGLDSIVVEKGESTASTSLMGFNQQINAGLDIGTVPSDFFANVYVRQAFVHAFDYATFISDDISGYGQRLNGVIPEGVFGYDPSIPYATYDLALAASLLESAPGPYGSWADSGFALKLYYYPANTIRYAQLEMLKLGLESL